MQDGAVVLARAVARGLKPDPVLTVSEWADRYRYLPSIDSSTPGKYSTAKTPYVREVADCLSVHHPAKRIVFMGGSQIGKTALCLSWIGYVIANSPGPMLVVTPTIETTKKFSKQRLDPMIQASPILRQHVREARSRDSGNSTFTKEFPGGMVILTWSNSGPGLRQMPIRYLFMDEIDAYPGEVGTADRREGDPISLAEQRTANFPRRKIFLTSTPTVEGFSRIEREYNRSDRRQYFVPCIHCGDFDTIRWNRIVWDEGKPETARLVCIACGRTMREHHKTELLARGEWRPTAESPDGTIGFHLSALYSPVGWKSWRECVEEFLRKKTNAAEMKTFVNLILGEPSREDGESIKDADILMRREAYGAEVPHGVGVLVAAVDVQGNRLEVKVVGYGAGEESWLIAYQQILGDPAKEAPWFEVDQFLLQKFQHESGRMMRIECVTVDSGGHHTEQVYRFCKAREGRRVWAIRGGSETGKPVVSRPSDHNRYKVRLFTLCVDTAKELIYSRLALNAPGPGYMHLPEWADEDYVAMLTAEKAIRKYVPRKGSMRVWVKIRERNEALDLEVYCLAALYILGPTMLKALKERATFFSTSPTVTPEASSSATSAPRRAPVIDHPTPGRRSGWVSGWRR